MKTNFCKDCKWMKRDWPLLPKCNLTTEVIESVDLITGKTTKTTIRDYCSIKRSNSGDCKPEGLLFEPKESLWKRWFK